mmetsp:Transcript_4645/g.6198  ORF Transcript_4645/g.6198 Transcript_4645/m.6198 type:complete len:366 (-) Transcript_4645:162-1259(-)
MRSALKLACVRLRTCGGFPSTKFVYSGSGSCTVGNTHRQTLFAPCQIREFHDLNGHKLIDGKSIAKRMRMEVKRDAKELEDAGFKLKLVSITFGQDAADGPIGRYVRNQRNVARKCGIEFEEVILSASIQKTDFVKTLEGLNTDPRISGVIMQRPFPEHLCVEEIQQCIHPLKDVEGMHPSSIGSVLYNETDLAPCTAKAAVACLKSTALAKNGLRGLECVVVGHSEIVGKPISFILMGEGATVTTCHHMTKDLGMHTRKADAVFIAVGKPGLIRGDMLKPGAAVVDVGINPVVTESGEHTIVGDADFKSCIETAGWITPVPGGVGPITTAILMQNTVLAGKAQRRRYEAAFGPSHTSNNVYLQT